MDDERAAWWRGAGMGAAVGLGSGIALTTSVVRRHLPRLTDYARRYVHRAVKVDNPVLIVNRWSGGGKAESVGLADAAEAVGIETVMLERDLDLVSLAEDAVKGGADAIGMAGGDGSLGLVASVAVSHDIPFFCVPVGTRNHFALDLGLDRDDPLAALAAVSAGREISIDHGLVGGRVFLNNVCLGVYPKAVKKEDYRDKKAESFIDTFVESAGSTEQRPDLRFRLPDGRNFESSPLMLVSNNPYTFSGPPDFGRRRRLDTGELGITAAVGTSDEADATVDLRPGDLQQWTATRYQVEAEGGTIEAGVDGESIDFPSPLSFEIRPRSLRVLIPKGITPGYVTPAEAMTAKMLDLVQLGGDPEELRP